MPAGDVQHSLAGVWRLMTGRADGLKLLDITADGFWNSFRAILLALPPLALGWVSYAGELAATGYGERPALVFRLFLAEMGAWLLPLVILALLARHIGLAQRFVPYVVASNWASVIFAWAMLPAVLMRLMMPEAGLAEMVSIFVFFLSLFFSWRMTVVVIDRGAAIGTAFFFAMLMGAITLLIWLQEMLGLVPDY
ncbi:hypothetical protein [Nitratireductor basaltis]|uniref:Yip1 domain-containing protein n=1 Tax=Nitratireductor basaltis TaxID=472175 RepID=A0A084UDC1_9HYPH|nr:hypothetical protein [Nitratireductor basaltis]KFB10957.1 hypothetical protein EL18_01998 [Nitratireductor basaltis]